MPAKMKFDEPLLQRYLVKTIEPLSEADPQLVANYVVALLKNNKPKEELQKICITQLDDFLGENTRSFVTKLFHALEDNTLLTSVDDLEGHKSGDETATNVHGDQKDLVTSVHGDRLPSAIVGTFADHDEQEGSNDDDDDRNPRHTRRAVDSPSLEQHEDCRDVCRKRGRSMNNVDSLMQNEPDISRQGRDSVSLHTERDGARKYQKTRHGTSFSSRINVDGDHKKGSHMIHSEAGAPNFDNINGSIHLPREQGRSLSNNSAVWNSHESRFPSLDNIGFAPTLPLRSGAASIYPPRTILNHGNTSNASWVTFAPMAGIPGGVVDQSRLLYAGLPAGYGHLNSSIGVGIGRGRLRCSDFEERGFCLRGDMCPMEHGKHIVVNDVQSLEKYNLSVSLPNRHLIGVGTGSNGGAGARKAHEKKHVNSSSPSTSVAEPDLYDPDQPLLTNGQPEGSGFRKLPSFRKGDGHSWDSELESADCGGNGKSQRSVWDRIGPLDNVGAKNDGPRNVSSSSGTMQKGNLLNENLYGDPQNYKSLGKRGTDNALDEEDEMKRLNDEGQSGEHRGINKFGAHVAVDSIPARYTEKSGPSTINPGSKGNHQSGQRAQYTLFVYCIPAGSNKAELLLSHFKKFGEVLAINIPPDSDRAFVRFSTREEAEAALSSPDAVMGNRFIRLAWAKWDKAIDPSRANAIMPGKKANAISGTYQQHLLKLDNNTLSNSPASQTKTTMISENRCQKISASAEPKHSAAPAPTQETLETLKMIKEKQELLAKKREEFRLHLERLSKQGSTNKMDDLNKDSGSKCHTTEEKASTSDFSLSDKPVSILENNVNAGNVDGGNVQGIAHQKQMTTGKLNTSAILMQALPRNPKLHTGPKLNPRRYKLDNRPTAFRILPPLPNGFQTIDVVRDHFASFGDVTNVEVENGPSESQQISETSTQQISETSSIRVVYVARHLAERAFIEGRIWEGQSLQLAWVMPSNTVNHAKIPPLEKPKLDTSSDEQVNVVPTTDKIISECDSVKGIEQRSPTTD
eukprot:TRINITY_DN12511_c0_g1_i1.p1 TRINITY_DN12511_c0_g1~~TRINITY_DN12511_c0_g1_i1.p1  ORF type:complete len:1026 (-),score=255.68 TRINITY_DN12511_c0_g1_i1:546-3623(-)